MRIERTVSLLAGQRAAILVDDAGRRYVAPLLNVMEAAGD